ncbi:MAG TPA: ABC transporter permease [Bryobacteraceae bacterium]|jgi:predicted permease
MPDWKKLVRERLAELRLTPGAEAELAEELAQDLEDRYRELCSGGAAEDAAYRNVLAELDNMQPLRESIESRQRLPKREPAPAGDSARGSSLQDFTRDLRYALRTMRKSPLFVVFVLLTLALGIGANTTVFTVINTLILNPLPVRNLSELAAVSGTDARSGAKSGATFPLSHADLKDYQARNGVFSSLAGYTSVRVVTSREHGVAERIFTELVTANYFSTLGLTPAKGRFFLPEEDGIPGAHAVAVMNYGVWQTRYGGDPEIVGKELPINGIVFTVIGVAPAKFIGVNAIFGPDVWIPAAMAERLLPNEMHNALSDRSKALFQAVGRYRPGASEAQAQADLRTLAAALAHDYPAADEGHTVMVGSVRDVLFGNAGQTSTMVFGGMALMAVVGIVLLIACSNVANLLLARSAVRGKEMAVRLAMGASRRRLVRQMLTESVLLGLLSGAIGLFLAYAGLQGLFGMLPSAANFATPKLDTTVFLFALAVSLATGFLFGTIPAIKASRASVAEALKEEARTTGRSRRRVTIGNALLTAQVAFSFLLLVTAALFLRSIGRAYEIDPGFQTAHLATFMTNPGQAGYSAGQSKAFYKEARARAARVPGVESVSWASNLPLWARGVNGLEVEGHEARSRSDKVRAIVNTVDTGYFVTAGVTIEQGREFTSADQEISRPVAIVNQKLAQDYWPGGALGKRIRLPGETVMREVVGVARTGNYSTWGEPPQACVFVPLTQNYSDAMVLFVRSRGNPAGILNPVQREVLAAGPQVLVGDRRTGSQIVDGGLFSAKMGVGLLSTFGLLALGLASIGLYGILAYSVNQRKREIGLRMALGASPSSVLRLVLKEGMTLVGAGMAIGLAASFAAGRLLSRMLFGVSARDPLSIAAAAVTLAAVALLACYLPARWATRVDPLAALHEQ